MPERPSAPPAATFNGENVIVAQAMIWPTIVTSVATSVARSE